MNLAWIDLEGLICHEAGSVADKNPYAVIAACP